MRKTIAIGIGAGLLILGAALGVFWLKQLNQSDFEKSHPTHRSDEGGIQKTSQASGSPASQAAVAQTSNAPGVSHNNIPAGKSSDQVRIPKDYGQLVHMALATKNSELSAKAIAAYQRCALQVDRRKGMEDLRASSPKINEIAGAEFERISSEERRCQSLAPLTHELQILLASLALDGKLPVGAISYLKAHKYEPSSPRFKEASEVIQNDAERGGFEGLSTLAVVGSQLGASKGDVAVYREVLRQTNIPLPDMSAFFGSFLLPNPDPDRVQSLLVLSKERKAEMIRRMTAELRDREEE